MNKNKKQCLLVAEIGTAHKGDLTKAFKLIDGAANAGADIAKFQYVIAREIIHPLTGEVKLPGGMTPLFDVFRSLEQSPDFYKELKSYTEKKGLIFLCSPFGIRSARALRDLGVDFLKIASPELNHLPLLEEATSYGIPLILSSGVSTLADVEEALTITGSNVTLLHCVTSYPAPEEDYNLNILPNLSGILGCPMGVSDHSTDPILVPLLALSRGAVMIEKHFTLSNEDKGLDDPIALTEKEFEKMTRGIHKGLTMPPEEILENLKSSHPPEKINKILGSGVKALAPSEKDNYGKTNRSLHALDEIKEGDLISEKNVAILRSEKNLPPGLHPRYFKAILGKKVSKSIKPGFGITWEHLLF